MRITLKQLLVFNAIAKSGQVAKAAEKINISAPATSMALAELEKQLDAKLFERRSNKLILNAQGRLLLPLADDVLQRVDKIEKAFNQKSTSFCGHLSVSASSTIGNHILAAASVAFGQKYSDVHIDLDICNTSDAIDAVIEGRSEMAFIEGHCLDKRLQIECWHQDHLQVFCHPDYELADKTVNSDQLRNKNWVLREEGSGTREIFVNTAIEMDMQPIEAFSFSHSEAIKSAVKQGAGLGVLSLLTLQQEFENKELSPINIEDLSLKRNFYLIRHHNRRPSALGMAFENFCDEWIKKQSNIS